MTSVLIKKITYLNENLLSFQDLIKIWFSVRFEILINNILSLNKIL